MDQFASTPSLQLESAPDSLYNQLFSGTGDISTALINSLGNLSLEPDQFNISDLDATQQKILADLGIINVGPEQFDLGSPQDIASTRDDLIDRLGKILLSPDSFGIGPNVAQDLRDRLNINVGEGQFQLDPNLATNLLSQLGLIEVGAGSPGTGGPGDLQIQWQGLPLLLKLLTFSEHS